MSGKPLPLTALRAFEATARLGSMGAAARALGIAQPSVSQQIRLLEARLGGRLFERHATGLDLTPRGHALHEEVAPAFAALRRAVAPAPAPETLRLSLFPTVAMRWLAPRMVSLRRDLPELRLVVETMPSWSPGLARGCDVSTRFGRGDWRGAPAVRLAEDRLVPVTTAGSAAERGGRPRIRCARRPDAGHLWEAAGAASLRRGVAPLETDTNLLATGMALAGAGIAIAPLAFVQDDLERGALVAEGAASPPEGRGYWFLASGVAPRPAVARFLDWAAAQGEA